MTDLSQGTASHLDGPNSSSKQVAENGQKSAGFAIEIARSGATHGAAARESIATGWALDDVGGGPAANRRVEQWHRWGAEGLPSIAR